MVDFHNFLAQSYMILTDSGGIQEAPSLEKPVLVIRDTTKRPEGIKAGTLKHIGTDEQTIYYNFKELLENKQIYDAMAHVSPIMVMGLRAKGLQIFWKINLCHYLTKKL